MPTLDQLFGTWEEEQRAVSGHDPSPHLRRPAELPAEAMRHPAALAALDVFDRARASGSTYDIQNARRFASGALATRDPTSLEAGNLRRLRGAADAALRARGEGPMPDAGFTQADSLRLIEVLGLGRQRARRRRDEEDETDPIDLLDSGGMDVGGGE